MPPSGNYYLMCLLHSAGTGRFRCPGPGSCAVAGLACVRARGAHAHGPREIKSRQLAASGRAGPPQAEAFEFEPRSRLGRMARL